MVSAFTQPYAKVYCIFFSQVIEFSQQFQQCHKRFFKNVLQKLFCFIFLDNVIEELLSQSMES